MIFSRLLLLILLALAYCPAFATAPKRVEMLHVSYDPTRRLFTEINRCFAKQWLEQTGQEVLIRQSHGGSGKQARSVIDGLRADLVSLALAGDIDAIAKRAELLPLDWAKKLPNNSCPFTSTIVFVVRKGNPKAIRDWDDLAKAGVHVITPNPKTSGGARWNYLAAWEYGRRNYGSEEQARDFVRRLYANAKSLDTGARGATTTFVQRGIGDVLISWESEAYLVLREFGPEAVEIITPSLSILAAPPVALIAKNAARKGTTEVAAAYLEFLYTDQCQELAASHFYRPTSPRLQSKYAAAFPVLKLFTVEEAFGAWGKAQKTHFDDGGEFDRLISQ